MIKPTPLIAMKVKETGIIALIIQRYGKPPGSPDVSPSA
ncbi:Uncharacterised protein [Vibrio cholerae]|uniref:Uncharacterized protein n=1 Tax=Vibrio cholerae TaxID=666 RepID=A0A655PIS9_VIBCL|nr:Uncharacterised protein [Vibrio cholerae]